MTWRQGFINKQYMQTRDEIQPTSHRAVITLPPRDTDVLTIRNRVSLFRNELEYNTGIIKSNLQSCRRVEKYAHTLRNANAIDVLQ